MPSRQPTSVDTYIESSKLYAPKDLCLEGYCDELGPNDGSLSDEAITARCDLIAICEKTAGCAALRERLRGGQDA